MQRSRFLAIFYACALGLWVSGVGRGVAFAAAPAASDLLAMSDRGRGATERGVTWEMSVKTTEDGEITEQAYRVRARGSNAYVETTAPPRKQGEVILFNDRAVWYFKPGLRKPVSVSAGQRLSGQAANADIACTNYLRDYDGTLSGEEVVQGEPTYRLELRARSPEASYERIRYWVSKARGLAVKAEFLMADGAVFKTATFVHGNHLVVDGADMAFVSQMTIADAAFPSNVTVITYAAPRYEDQPDALFSVSNLVR